MKWIFPPSDNENMFATYDPKCIKLNFELTYMASVIGVVTWDQA